MPNEESLWPDWPPVTAGPNSAEGGDETGLPKPRFKAVDRRQMEMRCIDIEALIEEDHPARAIWELVSRLDMTPFLATRKAVEGKAGRTPLDPRVLLSVWIYAYSQGVASAREVARLCRYHPAYQWLTALDERCGHSLSDFRSDHKEALEKLFVEILGVLSAEGLITLQRVMVDGTKIQANAAPDSFHRAETLATHLAAAREQVQALGDGEGEPSRQAAQARERAQQERQERLEAAQRELDKLNRASGKGTGRVSTSDPEARVMKQAEGGFAPSYNAQIATDAAHGMIVAAVATQAGNDFDQLLPTLEQVEENVGATPAQVVADGGYVSAENITAMAEHQIEFIGPAEDHAAKGAGSYRTRGVAAEFRAEMFVFDSASNSFRCPGGKVLAYEGQQTRGAEVSYKYRAKKGDCQACRFKPQCCPDNRVQGRSVQRTEVSPAVAAFRRKMQTEEARAIYRQRAQVAETPHLWIKAKFGLRQFLLRGLRKVGIELLWAAMACNVRQWYRLRWRPRREAAAPAPAA
jgi:transposase